MRIAAAVVIVDRQNRSSGRETTRSMSSPGMKASSAFCEAPACSGSWRPGCTDSRSGCEVSTRSRHTPRSRSGVSTVSRAVSPVAADSCRNGPIATGLQVGDRAGALPQLQGAEAEAEPLGLLVLADVAEALQGGQDPVHGRHRQVEGPRDLGGAPLGPRLAEDLEDAEGPLKNLEGGLRLDIRLAMPRS